MSSFIGTTCFHSKDCQNASQPFSLHHLLEDSKNHFTITATANGGEIFLYYFLNSTQNSLPPQSYFPNSPNRTLKIQSSFGL